jgi:hypothetical protein
MDSRHVSPNFVSVQMINTFNQSFPMFEKLIGSEAFQALIQRYVEYNSKCNTAFSVFVWTDQIGKTYSFASELVDLESKYLQKKVQAKVSNKSDIALESMEKPGCYLLVSSDLQMTVYRHSVQSIWVSLLQGHGLPSIWNLPEGAAFFSEEQMTTIRAFDVNEIEYLMDLQNQEDLVLASDRAQKKGVQTKKLLQFLIDHNLVDAVKHRTRN